MRYGRFLYVQGSFSMLWLVWFGIKKTIGGCLIVIYSSDQTSLLLKITDQSKETKKGRFSYSYHRYIQSHRYLLIDGDSVSEMIAISRSQNEKVNCVLT